MDYWGAGILIFYARRLWLDATKPIHVMVNGTKRVWVKHGMGNRSVGLV